MERETSDAFFKLERAKEELVRLKVEVRRLATYMAVEECRMRKALQALSSTQPDLAHQLRRVQQSMLAQFTTHRRRFATIEGLDGFEGSTQAGTPFGHAAEEAGEGRVSVHAIDVDDNSSRSRILAEALLDDDVEVGHADEEERRALESIEKAFEVFSVVD